MVPTTLHFRETRGSVRERRALEPQVALLAAGLLREAVGAPGGRGGMGVQNKGSKASNPRLGRWND